MSGGRGDFFCVKREKIRESVKREAVKREECSRRSESLRDFATIKVAAKKTTHIPCRISIFSMPFQSIPTKVLVLQNNK